MGQILEMDIETFSDVDLIKCGVYAYADSPAFEILLFGYSFDGGETQIIDLAQGEKLPAEVEEAIFDVSVTKTAYNANFERTCLSKYFGMYIPPESWHCSAVQAAMLALPRSLEDVGRVLGLDEQKMKEGKELIRYFCVPCKSTKANGGRTRNLPCHAPEKWELFKTYCKKGVAGCKGCNLFEKDLEKAFLTAWNGIVENREGFLPAWEKQIKEGNALEKWRAGQMVQLTAEPPLEAICPEIVNMTLESVEVHDGGLLHFRFLDGTELEIDTEEE